MKDRKLATRYARALLASLPDTDAAETADAFLAAIAAAMTESSDFRDVMLNPAVTRSARKQVLASLARERQVPERVIRFLEVVVDHGRTPHLPSIAEVFTEVREEAAGIVPVALETARPLPPDLVDRTRATMEKLTGKKVRMAVQVNQSLLGGTVARIGSMVYDGSLKTQLDILRRRMAGD
jgi:F-type H+-transporting ATPase subunit delta